MFELLKVLLKKEFTQYRRNPFLPRVTFAFPVAMMLVIPWVMNMDVQHVGVVVVDGDRSSLSQHICEKIDGASTLDLKGITAAFPEALKTLEKGRADVILEIPEGFSRSFAGTPLKVAIWANAVNEMKGNMGAQYLTRTVLEAAAEELGLELPESSVYVQQMYNPTLLYRNFMIPALMVMLLIIFGGMFPMLNLLGEKEAGTVEQINVSPVKPFQFVMAKLLMFWMLGIVVMGITMLLARWIYGLSPAGPVWVILLAALLFLATMSGLGISVANVSDTMLSGIFLMVFTVLIFMLLSGLLTPISSMPELIQNCTWALPPRYFISIMRSTYLRGAGFAEQWTDLLALAGFAVAFGLLAAFSYRKQQ